MEAGQNTGGMVIVKELAAKLQVQLASKLADTGADMLGLHLQIFLIVKAKSLDHGSRFLSLILYCVRQRCQ
jgi:hypothetical protein